MVAANTTADQVGLCVAQSASFEVVLKIQETCNLNCSYCYMYNLGNELHKLVPKAASITTCIAVADFIAREFEQRSPLYARLILHGGEPMLMPAHQFETRLKAIWDRLSERLPPTALAKISMSLQTNGTLVSDDWISLLSRWKISVGVSIDGPANVNDANRLDFKGRGSHASVLKGIGKLQAAAEIGLIEEIGALCVIDPGADGAAVYRHIVHELGMRRIDFLLPFVTWDTATDAHIQGVEQFLLAAFKCWSDDEPRPLVRIFDSALRRLVVPAGSAKSYALTEGVGHVVVVVESDGSISPEETLRQTVSERVTERTVFRDDIASLMQDERFGGVLAASLRRSPECDGCALIDSCGSGYGLGRVGQRFSSESRTFERRTVYCVPFRELFVAAAQLLTNNGSRMDRMFIYKNEPDLTASFAS